MDNLNGQNNESEGNDSATVSMVAELVGTASRLLQSLTPRQHSTVAAGSPTPPPNVGPALNLNNGQREGLTPQRIAEAPSNANGLGTTTEGRRDLLNRMIHRVRLPSIARSQRRPQPSAAAVKSWSLFNRGCGRGRDVSQPIRQDNIVCKKFICLSGPTDKTTPTSSRLGALKTHGLGVLPVYIRATASAEEVKSELTKKFPKLDGHEIELLRGLGSARIRQLVQVVEDSLIPSMSAITQSRAQVIYIRPLTEIVDMASEPPSRSETRDLADDDETDEYLEISSDEELENNTESGRTVVVIEESVTRTQTNPDIGSQDQDIDNVGGTRAISGQAPVTSHHTTDSLTLDDFRRKIHSDNAGVCTIFLDRKRDILESFMAIYIKNRDYNFLQTPFVQLEMGHDFGGPTREYFRLLHSGLRCEKLYSNFPLFEGDSNHKLPSSNPLLPSTQIFKGVGKFMAHSILNTGRAFYGLSSAVQRYLLTGNEDETVIAGSEEGPSSIPSDEVRQLLKTLQNWKSKAESLTANDKNAIRSYLSNLNITMAVEWESKELICHTMYHHELVASRRWQLQHLRAGFMSFPKVFDFVVQKSDITKDIFPSVECLKVSATALLNIIEFQGDYEAEEIQSLTGLISQFGDDEATKLVAFTTGGSELPKKIVFDRGDHDQMKFNTCYHELAIPLGMKIADVLDWLKLSLLLDPEFDDM